MNYCILLILNDIFIEDIAKYICKLYLQNIQFLIKIKYRSNPIHSRFYIALEHKSFYHTIRTNMKTGLYVTTHICHIDEIDLVLQDNIKNNPYIMTVKHLSTPFPSYMLTNMIKNNMNDKYDGIINLTNIKIIHQDYVVFKTQFNLNKNKKNLNKNKKILK